MNEQTRDRLGLKDWKLAYQGGHHNVFCDGERHAWTNGGYTELEPMSYIARVGKCDCAKWQTFEFGIAEKRPTNAETNPS